MNNTLSFPHRVAPRQRVVQCITETIGNTPMLQLQRLCNEEGTLGQVFAKLEYFNPAGSIKDRAAKAMFEHILNTHQHAKLNVIEATSGNSGVACAWLGAIHQVPVTIVMPEHMSKERQQLIRFYGANLVLTSETDGMPGAMAVAETLLKTVEGAVSMDQFANPVNAAEHARSTAREIWQDMGEDIDVVVTGMGTGGTATGIGRILKQQDASIEIVIAEPSNCPLLSEGKAGSHGIPGVHPGLIPPLLDKRFIDKVLTVTDDAALDTARRAARKEGIAVGISSGATLSVALSLARQPAYRGKKIVAIAADGAERYFSTPLFSQLPCDLTA